MIEVEHLTKKFGHKTAVNNISFELTKGKVMGFIGPNGAGKSTTMRMITGFLPMTTGRIKIGKYDIAENPIQAKSAIGYLPENAPLYSNKTVNEFLDFAAELRNYRGIEKWKRIDKAIETCFLEAVRNQSIDTLSKGYKQRTCFAQAILHDPDILILDEPTDGLDPNQKVEVRKLIREMGKNKAIIISTHILEEVEAVTSDVLLIAHGKKIFEGTPEKLKNQSLDANTFTIEILNKKSEELSVEFRKFDFIIDIETLNTGGKSAKLKFTHKKKTSRNEVKKAVASLIAKKRWEVGEFTHSEGKLTEVFARLTSRHNVNKEAE